jgi:hypothetical protein
VDGFLTHDWPVPRVEVSTIGAPGASVVTESGSSVSRSSVMSGSMSVQTGPVTIGSPSSVSGVMIGSPGTVVTTGVPVPFAVVVEICGVPEGTVGTPRGPPVKVNVVRVVVVVVSVSGVTVCSRSVGCVVVRMNPQ